MYLITQFYKDRRAIIVPTLNAYALPVTMIRNIAVTRRPARSLKNTTRENDYFALLLRVVNSNKQKLLLPRVIYKEMLTFAYLFLIAG